MKRLTKWLKWASIASTLISIGRFLFGLIVALATFNWQHVADMVKGWFNNG